MFNNKVKILSIIFLGVLFAVIIAAYESYWFIAQAAATVALMILFIVADHYWNIGFKTRHYIFMLIISITSFLLSDLYFVYSYYDKILHFVIPMLLGSLVFHMVTKLDLRVKWRLLFTFLIISASLGIFEMGEYSLDYFFDLQLQGVYVRDFDTLEKYQLVLGKIDDTMLDMMLGTLGALVYVTSDGIGMFFKRKFIKYRAQKSRRFPLNH